MSNEIDQLKILTQFGKVGVQMLSARILSMLSLAGLLGAGGATIFFPSWHAVCVCVILAVVAISAHRGESRFNATEPQ